MHSDDTDRGGRTLSVDDGGRSGPTDSGLCSYMLLSGVSASYRVLIAAGIDWTSPFLQELPSAAQSQMDTTTRYESLSLEITGRKSEGPV